MEQDLVNIFT